MIQHVTRVNCPEKPVSNVRQHVLPALRVLHGSLRPAADVVGQARVGLHALSVLAQLHVLIQQPRMKRQRKRECFKHTEVR